MSPAVPALDPTERLLVELSRVRPHPAPAPAPVLRPGVDGARLLGLASRIGNFSLVARRYLALDPGLDPELRARAERNLNHIDLRERLVLADVAELGRRMAVAGEPMVLLKGAAYSRFIYPQRGMRTFLDVDVLVRPRAVEGARRALEALGYGVLHQIEGAIDMSRAIGTSPISLKIELHTNLVHHYNFPWYRAELALSEERLIERSEERVLDQAPVRVLAAPDELLYSVLHFFFHHDLEGLRYHSDLNALLGDPRRPLDVDGAIASAEQARAGIAVGLALAVQERLFGPGAVPPALLAGLEPRGLRRRLLERVLPPLDRLPLVEGRVAGHPAKVLAAPGWRAPAGLAWRWLFPGRRFLEGFYGLAPGAWRGSYHLRYPAAILRKALRRVAASGA